jgi:hypothetical protein
VSDRAIWVSLVFLVFFEVRFFMLLIYRRSALRQWRIGLVAGNIVRIRRLPRMVILTKKTSCAKILTVVP